MDNRAKGEMMLTQLERENMIVWFAERYRAARCLETVKKYMKMYEEGERKHRKDK